MIIEDNKSEKPDDLLLQDCVHVVDASNVVAVI